MQQLPCLGVIKYMNCRKSLAALVLAAVLAVTGCGAAEGAGGGAKTNTEAESGSGAKTNVKAQEKDIHERTVFAMTTIMSLRVYHPDGEAILDQAEEEIRRIEAVFSTGILRVRYQSSTQPGKESSAKTRRSCLKNRSQFMR